MSKLKKEHKEGIELPGMPDGTVPKDIRVGAEAVVRHRLWMKDQKEELKQLEETLMSNMAREKVGVAVVILDGRKYRLFYQGTSPKIAIREEGMTPEYSNGQAPKNAG